MTSPKQPININDFNPYRKCVPEFAQKSFDYVVENPNFFVWPGSSDKHHNWHNGLAQHTLEVMQIGLKMAEVIDLDKGILVIATLWHDFGKLWAYETSPIFESPKWVDTKLKHLTGGHLARSYAEYLSYIRDCEGVDFNEHPTKRERVIEFQESVGHCILAHHGCREWGSVTRPQTREAFVLHMADQASARLLGGEIIGSRK